MHDSVMNDWMDGPSAPFKEARIVPVHGYTYPSSMIFDEFVHCSGWANTAAPRNQMLWAAGVSTTAGD